MIETDESEFGDAIVANDIRLLSANDLIAQLQTLPQSNRIVAYKYFAGTKVEMRKIWIAWNGSSIGDVDESQLEPNAEIMPVSSLVALLQIVPQDGKLVLLTYPGADGFEQLTVFSKYEEND